MCRLQSIAKNTALELNLKRCFLFRIRADISRRSRLRKSRCSSEYGLVEATGIEPVSENSFPKPSPSAVVYLKFPHPSAKRQAKGLGSL